MKISDQIISSIKGALETAESQQDPVWHLANAKLLTMIADDIREEVKRETGLTPGPSLL